MREHTRGSGVAQLHRPKVVDWLLHLRDHRLSLLRSGARALIEQAEWEAEKVIHLARAGLVVGFGSVMVLSGQVSVGSLLATTLAFVIGTLTGWTPTWRVAPGSALDWTISGVTLLIVAVLWTIYWRILQHHQVWRWLRFPLIVADTGAIVRMAVAMRSTKALGVDDVLGLTPDHLARLVPLLLTQVTFSGVLRMSPFTAGLAGVSAMAGQVAIGLILGLSFGEIVPEFTLLAVTWFIGMQFVFVLRGMALKAAEEDVLERFVPQGLTQRLAHAGGIVPARVVPVTILIADIRGFTQFSEPLGPDQAVKLLNDFFAAVVGPLAAEGAVLDKYLGDGLLAYVEGDDHAARGLRAAHGVVAAVDALNARRVAIDPPLPPLRMGIAVHTDHAFVGSMGAPVRMEYTIIGDAVNVTSRLEGLMSSKAGAERIDAVLIASADTTMAAAESGAIMPDLHGPKQVAVHGRAQPLEVYYLPPAEVAAMGISAAAAVD